MKHFLSCLLLILFSCNNLEKSPSSENIEDHPSVQLDSSIKNNNAIQTDSTNGFIDTKEDLPQTDNNKFDVAKYKKLKKGNVAKYFLNDSLIVELSDITSNYIEIRKKVNSNLERKILYNKITRNKENEGEYLCGQRIGLHKEYEKAGQIAKTIDYDEHFKISVNELTKIILKDCQIDIMNSKNSCSMYRIGPEPVYYYQLFIVVKPRQLIFFRIDGNTGEILEKSYKSVVD